MSAPMPASAWRYVRVVRGSRMVVHRADCRHAGPHAAPWSYADGLDPTWLADCLAAEGYVWNVFCGRCLPGLDRTAGRPAQLTIDEARQARDVALSRVARASTADEVSAVDAAIEQVAKAGRPFSANDVRPLLPAGVRTPLIGRRFADWARAGRLARVGDVTSTDRATHAHRIGLWQEATP